MKVHLLVTTWLGAVFVWFGFCLPAPPVFVYPAPCWMNGGKVVQGQSLLALLEPTVNMQN